MSAARAQNRATDGETKAGRTLTRDEGFGFRAAHWGDLHRRLHEALPAGVTVLWGHQFVSFEMAPEGDGDGGVVVTARVLRTGETVEVAGDLLVAADGCTSAIRRRFLPELKLRSARGSRLLNCLLVVVLLFSRMIFFFQFSCSLRF